MLLYNQSSKFSLTVVKVETNWNASELERGVNLTTRLHLVLWLRYRGTIPPKGEGQRRLYLYLSSNSLWVLKTS